LAALDDEFPGDSLNVKLSTLNAVTVEITPTVADGSLFLSIARGGIDGSRMIDGDDYSMIYQNVTGAFDARARCRVTGSDGSSAVGTSSTRLGALNVADPDNATPTMNYVQIAAGSVAGTALQYQWATTDIVDNADGTAAGNAGLTGAITGVDFRVVRRAGDLQIFDLYVRQSSLATNLLDDNDWTLAQTVDREDNTTPDRDALGAAGNAAVALPATVRVGLAVGAVVVTHNVAMYCSEFRVRTPA
jgi:hypothetical protein